MPDGLLGSGTLFDRARSQAAQWIKEKFGGGTSLTNSDLREYGRRRFIVGWSIRLTIAGEERTLHVVLDERFPYSPVRVALASKEAYLQWPHVENQGLLCLPPAPPPIEDVPSALETALSAGVQLIDRCVTNPAFVSDELKREFVSYWGYSCRDDSLEVRSLLDVGNPASREIAVWSGKRYTLVGESVEQLDNWLRHMGRDEKSEFSCGVFGRLSEPPIFPLPARCQELLQLLERTCPETAALLLRRIVPSSESHVVLSAECDGKIGVVACALTHPAMKNGFRPNVALNPAGRKILLVQSTLERHKITRVDGEWIHSRAMNPKQNELRDSTVAILGCGALGSQVALRLAQIGVGTLILVDPETLAAANIGRHALGMDSLGEWKSEQLARLIRRRYPHLRTVVGLPQRWENVSGEQLTTIEKANAIVSCIGEWSGEGLLNEWHIRGGAKTPIVYGWLGEHGATAHAVAVLQAGPCLACMLNRDGSMRDFEIDWPGEQVRMLEPACGTEYHPFGPIEVGRAEALVSNLVVDVLSAAQQNNCHRIYATSTEHVTILGGKWSDRHLAVRNGFEGSIEFAREFVRDQNCTVCGAK